MAMSRQVPVPPGAAAAPGQADGQPGGRHQRLHRVTAGVAGAVAHHRHLAPRHQGGRHGQVPPAV